MHFYAHITSPQLIEAQAKELADKCRLIDALQDKLSRLSDLAAAFTDEMDGANHLIASTGMPPYQPLATMQAQLQTAPEQKPAVPTPEQLLNLPTACHLLHHLHEQMQQQQHHSSRQQNATAAAGAMCLPSAGSKRARVSSATGSGGEAIKHAFAASGGSSSSHQQLSAHEALDEDMDDDAAAEYQDEEATARCFSVKRSRSPNNYEQMPGEAAAAAAGHMAEEEDLDAAQCLQELAQGPNVTTAKPSAQETLPGKDIEERFAGEPNRVAGSNLVRYGSAGHTNATLPGAAAGAATGRAGSSSSIGGGGNSSMFGQWTPEQAIAFMAAQLKADGFAGFHNPHVQQQGAQPAQPRVSMPFGSAQQPQAAQPQQQRQQHFDGLTAQRSGSLGRPWGAAAKSPAAAAPSGPSGAPVRPPYRKQSWVSGAGRASHLQGLLCTCRVCVLPVCGHQQLRGVSYCLVAAVLTLDPCLQVALCTPPDHPRLLSFCPAVCGRDQRQDPRACAAGLHPRVEHAEEHVGGVRGPERHVHSAQRWRVQHQAGTHWGGRLAQQV
jgi:hypothetical protein